MTHPPNRANSPRIAAATRPPSGGHRAATGPGDAARTPTAATRQHHPTEEAAMQLDRPAQGGDPRRRLRGLLIWSGLTLLAALALALAMVIASLALELGTESAPSPTSP